MESTQSFIKISSPSLMKQGYNQRRFRMISVTTLLAILTICLCTMMLVYGNTNYSLDVVFKVLSGEKIQGAIRPYSKIYFSSNHECYSSYS